MNKNDIQQLYEFNRWANARILDAVSKLTPEQFTTDLSSSFRSVRDTLVHLLSAEWIWLRRWQGTSPAAMLSPSDFPDLAALRAKWAEVEREQAEFIEHLTEESLAATLAYTNTKGERWEYPLGQLMQHVVNHGSYHRGQITAFLRQLGAEAVATDFLVFIDVKSKAATA
jgi:uncharacterized damage-inducible protein DinB